MFVVVVSVVAVVVVDGDDVLMYWVYLCVIVFFTCPRGLTFTW